MNESGDFPSELDDDAMLEALLAPLQSLEPSLEARVRNRMAVADELRRLWTEEQKRRPAWWQRRLSIPVPIAAAAVLAMVVGLTLVFSFSNRGEPAAAPAKNPSVKRLPAPRSLVTYRQTETYLCGVGRLNSEFGYFIEEDSHD